MTCASEYDALEFNNFYAYFTGVLLFDAVLREPLISSYFQLVNVSNPVTFSCKFSGIPVPSVNWIHPTNDRIVIETSSNDTHITSTLSIELVIPEDTDVYMCTASTPEFTVSVSYDLVVGMYLCMHLSVCQFRLVHLSNSMVVLLKYGSSQFCSVCHPL